jgi:hypothetical protein
MAKLVPTVGPYEAPPLKRVSWGAIFGGTFISLAIMVLLGSLGIAIGATTIDPHTGETPSLRAFGIGAGIWWIVGGMLALFGGGWAAGRLAGPRRRLESSLHGVVTWAFTTTAAVALMTTAVGSMISGAMRVLGIATTYVAAQDTRGAGAQRGHMGGVDLRDTGITARTPDLAPAWQEVWGEAQEKLKEAQERLREKQQDIREEIRDDVNEAEQALENRANRTTLGTEQTGVQQHSGLPAGRAGIADHKAARVELEAALSRLLRNAKQPVSAADKRAVVDVLVARTYLDREAARELVDDWSETFQKAWQPTFDFAMPGGMTRGESAAMAEGAAVTVANAAWWTFFYFILTAIAGGLGGMLGALRRRREGVEVVVTDTRTVTP